MPNRAITIARPARLSRLGKMPQSAHYFRTAPQGRLIAISKIPAGLRSRLHLTYNYESRRLVPLTFSSLTTQKK